MPSDSVGVSQPVVGTGANTLIDQSLPVPGSIPWMQMMLGLHPAVAQGITDPVGGPRPMGQPVQDFRRFYGPVGTEQANGQSMGPAQGPFDPVVQGPLGKPMLQSEANRMIAGARIGALGIIGGPNAAEAPLANLAEGADLAHLTETGLANYTPEDIWKMTGTFKGADGLWRHEIPDETALSGTRAQAALGQSSTLPLRDVLDHPELYKQYPQLADMPISHVSIPGIKAAYDPVTKEILVRPGLPPEDFHSAILHETQHAVQHIEGFDSGTNSSALISPQDRKFIAGTEKVTNSINGILTKAGIDPDSAHLLAQAENNPATAQYLRTLPPDQQQALQGTYARLVRTNLLEPLKKIAANNTQADIIRQNAMDQYMAAPGEVEARTVEARQFYDAKMRNALYPGPTGSSGSP